MGDGQAGVAGGVLGGEGFDRRPGLNRGVGGLDGPPGGDAGDAPGSEGDGALTQGVHGAFLGGLGVDADRSPGCFPAQGAVGHLDNGLHPGAWCAAIVGAVELVLVGAPQVGVDELGFVGDGPRAGALEPAGPRQGEGGGQLVDQELGLAEDVGHGAGCDVEDRREHRRDDLVGVREVQRGLVAGDVVGPLTVEPFLLAAGEGLDAEGLDRRQGRQCGLGDLDDRHGLVLVHSEDGVVAQLGQRSHGVQRRRRPLGHRCCEPAPLEHVYESIPPRVCTPAIHGPAVPGTEVT